MFLALLPFSKIAPAERKHRQVLTEFLSKTAVAITYILRTAQEQLATAIRLPLDREQGCYLRLRRSCTADCMQSRENISGCVYGSPSPARLAFLVSSVNGYRFSLNATEPYRATMDPSKSSHPSSYYRLHTRLVPKLGQKRSFSVQ